MCSQYYLPIAAVLCAIQVHGGGSFDGAPEPQDLIEWRKYIADSGPLYEEGHFREATEALEKALRHAERFGPLDVRLPTTIHALGFLYQEQGKYSKAANLYSRAIHLWERIGPDQHDAILQSTGNLIGTYMESHNYSAASKLMASRLPEMELSATKWKDRAILLNLRASLAETEHRYSKAESLYRESLALWEQHGPTEDKNIAIVLMNLSHVFATTKRNQNALDMALGSLAILEKLDPTVRPLTIKALDHAGMLYMRLRRPGDAERLYRRALTLVESSFGQDHTVRAYIMLRYSPVLRALHQDSRAKTMATEAETILRRSGQTLTIDVHELMASDR